MGAEPEEGQEAVQGLRHQVSAQKQLFASSIRHARASISGPEAGSYLRLIDFVYHSTLGLGVIKKKRRRASI